MGIVSIVRIILTAIVLYFAYFETGWVTTLILVMLSISNEMQSFLLRKMVDGLGRLR